MQMVPQQQLMMQTAAVYQQPYAAAYSQQPAAAAPANAQASAAQLYAAQWAAQRDTWVAYYTAQGHSASAAQAMAAGMFG